MCEATTAAIRGYLFLSHALKNIIPQNVCSKTKHRVRKAEKKTPQMNTMSRIMRKPVFRVSDMLDTRRAVQPQKVARVARGLKFWI